MKTPVLGLNQTFRNIPPGLTLTFWPLFETTLIYQKASQWCFKYFLLLPFIRTNPKRSKSLIVVLTFFFTLFGPTLTDKKVSRWFFNFFLPLKHILQFNICKKMKQRTFKTWLSRVKRHKIPNSSQNLFCT